MCTIIKYAKLLVLTVSLSFCNWCDW